MSRVLSLSERADRVIRARPELSALKLVIEKELLHLDLFYLLSHYTGHYPAMTFIGGTCLRLCYDASRYSEDLDFHAGPEFTAKGFDDMRLIIERYLSDRYQLSVEVKSPKLLKDDPDYSNTGASTWKIIVNTHPERRDMPAQRLHIDIANIPTHQAEPRLIRPHYADIPDGYDGLLFECSSLTEILADKMIAIAARASIKARDLWDVGWLLQNRVQLDRKLVHVKINDHKISDFNGLMTRRLNELDTYFNTPVFAKEMSRFLEGDRYRRTVQNPEFITYLKNQLKTILLSAIAQPNDETHSPFLM